MYMHVHVCTCIYIHVHACVIYVHYIVQVHCIYIHYDEFLSQKGFILNTALHRNFIAWYFKSILLENGISRYNLLLGDNVSHTYQQNLHRIQCVEAVQELDYVSPHQAKVRNSSLFCLYIRAWYLILCPGTHISESGLCPDVHTSESGMLGSVSWYSYIRIWYLIQCPDTHTSGPGTWFSVLVLLHQDLVPDSVS